MAATPRPWPLSAPVHPDPVSDLGPRHRDDHLNHRPPTTTARTPPDDTEQTAADLRNQVVDRLHRFNGRHALHAWDRRYHDPLGPHALAFLYAQPAPAPAPADADPPIHPYRRWQLRTATRLFLAGPEVADLPRLLYAQTLIARRQRVDGGLDPRTEMANRSEAMGDEARYCGVGVSTLDVRSGSWVRMQQVADGVTDIPGRCFALLRDATMLLVERGARHDFGELRIYSTHTLDVAGQRVRRWAWARELAELADPTTAPVWQWLAQLHHALLGTGP